MCHVPVRAISGRQSKSSELGWILRARKTLERSHLSPIAFRMQTFCIARAHDSGYAEPGRSTGGVQRLFIVQIESPVQPWATVVGPQCGAEVELWVAAYVEREGGLVSGGESKGKIISRRSSTNVMRCRPNQSWTVRILRLPVVGILVYTGSKRCLHVCYKYVR